MCAFVSRCADETEFQQFAKLFQTSFAQITMLSTKLSDFVASESTLTQGAVGSVVEFVKNFEADASESRVASYLEKTAGLHTQVSFQQLVSLLISRSFTADVLKFNASLSPSAASTVFAVISSTVLRSIRLAHATQCLSSTRALCLKLADLRLEALAASIPAEILQTLARSGCAFLFSSVSLKSLRDEFHRDVAQASLDHCSGDLEAARFHLHALLADVASCCSSAQATPSVTFPCTDWEASQLPVLPPPLLVVLAFHLAGYAAAVAHESFATTDFAEIINLVSFVVWSCALCVHY
jgi:hypothetical protein